VGNLNSGQFNDAFDVGAQQRRKKERRGLAGAYVGLGSYWNNYPYVYGTMGTGGSLTNGVLDTGVPSTTSDGGGIGGTLTGLSGTSG
jgi:hypothetical protein